MDDLMKLGDNRILLPITVDRKGTVLLKLCLIKRGLVILAGIPILNLLKALQHICALVAQWEIQSFFPVDGDSMPHKSGFFIVGRYVEKLGDVMDGKTYILLTKNKGLFTRD
jgi:hypothetical protein